MKPISRPQAVCRALSRVAVFLCLLVSLPALRAAPALVLNEIHYHPVERPAFDASGLPVLDLTDDVHEFVEIYNAGPTNVSLAGWRLTGDVDYDFPTNAVIVAGRYLVVAKNPARLLSISQYALSATNVFGPFQRNLSNRSGTVRLRDALDNTVDSVSYSSEFPWAIGADALGADDEWTGLVSSNFQYRGRSLERVSATWLANDPANWVASPTNGNPTPTRANTAVRAVPKPVVIALSASQGADGAALIRASQPVRVDCTFSATNLLSSVSVEYFLDDINQSNEARTTAGMSVAGLPSEGRYTVVLPGQANRTIVRYRIRANRGTGVETVSPRADDPFAWHAYFVTPLRASTNRIYDCFLATNSWHTLATNLNPASPSSVDVSVRRRIRQPDPPGLPSLTWNATEPAVFVADGVVYDARARFHGSQYRRSPLNNSWKWQFPRYKKLDDREGIFISDNDDTTVACGILYRLAGVPQSYTRWIDFYLTTNTAVAAPLVRRMDQDEMDDGLLERFFAERRQASPELPRESSGEFYKSQGNFLFSDPTGPFGYGGYRLLAARPPYWTELQRYEHTFGLQMNGWKGHGQFRDMLHGLWAARGDTHVTPNPSIPALRAWLSENFDVDTTLTSMAIRVWTGGWDNFNHNHFAWRRANGKWVPLQWDFDGELNPADVNSSIYLSEFGAPLIYPTFGTIPLWVDANWINDSMFKAFREEYKRKLFILNNTLLNPTNITAIGLGSERTFADGRFAWINSQVGLGLFYRPGTPTNLSPGRLEAALPPAMFVASPYTHGAPSAPAHGSTTWWIRATNGSYAAPVLKTTSTSNLTSLPIPFGELTFGESYFWKCLYTDTNGHPSFESAETAFTYGAGPSFAPLIALDTTTQWRFYTNTTAPPAGWNTITFDDGTWTEGAALIADDTGPLPEPIRTPIQRGNRIANYFRKTFTFSGNPTNAQIRLRHVIDDGAVFYLNGVEIHRIGMPTGVIFSSTPANRTVTDAIYEGPFHLFPTNLVNGTNVLACTVRRSSTIGPDVVFGATLDVAVPPMPGNVVINEIVAENRSAVTNAGKNPDYIELFNTTATTQSLAGLSLSDNVERPGKFVFPPGTMIPPQSHLVVWCDDETNAPGLHTGFALDNDGQTVALFTIVGNGYVLADSVTFGLQIPDYALARDTDGSGAWVLAQPTPGATHAGVTLDDPAGLKLNEWMATDAGGPDWFELYNPSTAPVALGGLLLTDDLDAPTNSRIAALSFIAPHGFRLFIADENPETSSRHVNFKLSGTGEAIGLFHSYGVAIDAVTFGPQISGVSEGRLPDGAVVTVAFATTASPGEPNYLPLDNVIINEVLSHSDPPLEDAIELFNPSGLDADISGWWLSDEKLSPQKYQLPPGSVVPAGGFLTLYEGQFNASPGASGSFALNSARGDQVYLSAADALGDLTGYRAEASFDPAESGVTHGRFETSHGTIFTALASRTFDGANAYAKVGPVVVSEIMFRPPDFPGGFDNDRDEYIELRNITASEVQLFDPGAPTNRWRLRDAVDFTFPPNTTLAPNETVLVVGFDPLTNAAALAGFLDAYGQLSVRIFGPWSGKLDNSSDSVELMKPDPPVAEPGPDFGYVPSILVDRVKYADSFPWPETADGTGLSLMRSVQNAFGNDPVNWFAWVPTVGGENVYNAPPVANLTSPADGASIPGPALITLTATASDDDGSIAVVDFFDGTNKIGSASSAPFTFAWAGASFGPHTLTARARDDRNATGLSAPVNIQVVSQPPVVALTAPTNGSLFAAGNLVSLAASAMDPDTPVTRVEYLVDGAVVAQTVTPPYATNWLATPGSHQIFAIATDLTGGRGTSAPARIFVQAVAFTETILVASNSTWRYNDTGANLGTAWTNLNHADNTWSNGVAELGYGDSTDGRPEATVISFGPNSANKYITYYFRQKFVLPTLEGIAGATLRVMRDDGAVGYLNGVEVFRNNMPAGVITYTTLAPLGLTGVEEYTFHATNISLGRLVSGTNILAIEIHQNATNSSDLSFAAEFRVTRTLLGPAIVSAPQSVIAMPDGPAMFTVSAVGTGPLEYQWHFNGEPIPGETGTTLLLANVQPSQAGAYSVSVSNSVGLVSSDPAALAVGDSDIDGDGLPDAWEIAHRLDPFSPADLLLDSDGDRMSNQAEFIAGTDPRDAQSALRIDSIAFGRAMVIRFAAEGIPYSVEYSDSLGGPWVRLMDLPAIPGVESLRFADPLTSSNRFYRITTAEFPLTPLVIDSFSITNAALLGFNAVSNRIYSVEFTDAPGADPWMPLLTIPAQPVTRQATVADPASVPSRIYRLLLTPAP